MFGGILSVGVLLIRMSYQLSLRLCSINLLNDYVLIKKMYEAVCNFLVLKLFVLLRQLANKLQKYNKGDIK